MEEAIKGYNREKEILVDALGRLDCYKQMCTCEDIRKRLKEIDDAILKISENNKK